MGCYVCSYWFPYGLLELALWHSNFGIRLMAPCTSISTGSWVICKSLYAPIHLGSNYSMICPHGLLRVFLLVPLWAVRISLMALEC